MTNSNDGIFVFDNGHVYVYDAFSGVTQCWDIKSAIDKCNRFGTLFSFYNGVDYELDTLENYNNKL